ncbi:chlorocatechol-degradation protein [Exidia glandulosa HHB12029]|uniref:Chlorocatechol-degradation protein n=1 Tax=Exidia glandulosa HHB12029 TaxID=1314781 RepID=A0A165J7Q4_EXIGL|nr:chlorocatechol-degradation protein [Exidia glandulosa HHB12029]
MFSKSLLALAALATAAFGAQLTDFQTEMHNVGQALDGEPAGFMTKIEGVDTYVTLPKGLRAKPREAVVFLTDIFGLALVNSKLLADQFAAKGFATFAPDYLNGDPVPVNQTGFNMTAWSLRHTEVQTTPPLLSVIDGLSKFGVKKLAATGYCFGGLYILRLAQNNTIAVGATAHPSALSVPDDFLKLSDIGKTPLQIHSAELDTAFTQALAATADSVLNATGTFSDLTPYAPGYNRINHLGVGHGFAVRPANASDPVQIAAMQAAFSETVDWFSKHL